MDITSSRCNRFPSTYRAFLAIPLAALLATFATPSAAAGRAVESTANATSEKTTSSIGAEALQPGDFVWTPERSAPGQVVIVVSLPEQRAHVYRNGVRIGVSTVSTGTASHPTPTGTFEILQKKRINYSNLYNNAPMPFMQRLTWDGIALHAGRIPGYPASHGCVRLPLAFAEKLFAETQRGIRVVIADESSHDMAVVYPGDQAPVDAYSGLPITPVGEQQATRSLASAP